MSGKRIRWVTEAEAMEEEKKSPSKPDVQVGPKLKKAEDLSGFPVFDPNVSSLLAKNLTRQVWE